MHPKMIFKTPFIRQSSDLLFFSSNQSQLRIVQATHLTFEPWLRFNGLPQFHLRRYLGQVLLCYRVLLSIRVKVKPIDVVLKIGV